MLPGPTLLLRLLFSLELVCEFAAGAVVSRSTPSPKPIVIPASQNFEGNDGPWSSFTLRIGSPAQNVNVLISTAGAQTLPVAPPGCISSDPANCAQLRGGLFTANQSTTWTPNTLSPNKTDTFALGLEANLGYSANGKFGFDTVVLGWQGSGGPSLDQQIVGEIASKEFYLGLFVEACEKFESAFDLTWNETVQAYLVNDTLHDALKSKNSSVRFTLGNSTNQSSGTVDITLPYAAFDLIASSPLAPNSTRYFPLVRATNESQYTLGRTFLQEAYLITDYERRNFSISQCSWIDNAQQDIKSITAPADEGAFPNGSKALSSAAIAGIAVGVVSATATSLVLLYFCVFRPRRHRGTRRDLDKEDDTNATAELDVKEKPLELDGKRWLGAEAHGKAIQGSELDSKPYLGEELNGSPTLGPELDGKIYIGNEVEGSNIWPQELGAKGVIASELPA
ncbi:MAG: hypothetical protein Q9220_004323 [cf. Caloplaca sp. 1 TL-2023]